MAAHQLIRQNLDTQLYANDQVLSADSEDNLQ